MGVTGVNTGMSSIDALLWCEANRARVSFLGEGHVALTAYNQYGFSPVYAGCSFVATVMAARDGEAARGKP